MIFVIVKAMKLFCEMFFSVTISICILMACARAQVDPRPDEGSKKKNPEGKFFEEVPGRQKLEESSV